MAEEQIKAMAEEYKAEYVPMYQKVAQQAYIDGMMDALKFIKEKMQNL